MQLPLFRNHSWERYYLKYYCKFCKSFSIRVHTDTACECENDCTVSITNIDFNNYSGFFDRQEIEENFYLNEFQLFEILSDITKVDEDIKINFKTLSKKEADNINTLISEKYLTEIKIDDIVAKHLKINNLNKTPSEFGNFGYIMVQHRNLGLNLY